LLRVLLFVTVGHYSILNPTQLFNRLSFEGTLDRFYLPDHIVEVTAKASLLGAIYTQKT